jgi:F-type H+-transporting ATPase subunit b
MSAEEGHGSSGGRDFAGKIVNFLVLFGGLTMVLYKPVRQMLGKHGADIRQNFAAAKDRREEAEKKYNETAARLGGLGSEVGRLKAEAEEDARRAVERIGKAASAEAEKIRRFAEQEIEEKVRGGVRALKAYAAEAAASLARERVRKKLTSREQAVLIDKSIERLTRRHEEPSSHQ